MTFVQEINWLIGTKGLGQGDGLGRGSKLLADGLGVAQSAVTRWRNGAKPSPAHQQNFNDLYDQKIIETAKYRPLVLPIEEFGYDCSELLP